MGKLQWFGALLAIAATSSDGAPFSGVNCELKQPPAESGEDGIHGYAMKVYPRTRGMSKDYTGCVTTWMPTNAGYEILGVTA
ncbi:MAG TPA: hypothetical protein VN782_08605 [Usitatibacter sp.]|nr:hypothetical protein [Usitatibacter sp.]